MEMTEELLRSTQIAQVTKSLMVSTQVSEVVRKRARGIRHGWKRQRARAMESGQGGLEQQAEATAPQPGVPVSCSLKPSPRADSCRSLECPLAHPKGWEIDARLHSAESGLDGRQGDCSSDHPEGRENDLDPGIAACQGLSCTRVDCSFCHQYGAAGAACSLPGDLPKNWPRQPLPRCRPTAAPFGNKASPSKEPGESPKPAHKGQLRNDVAGDGVPDVGDSHLIYGVASSDSALLASHEPLHHASPSQSPIGSPHHTSTLTTPCQPTPNESPYLAHSTQSTQSPLDRPQRPSSSSTPRPTPSQAPAANASIRSMTDQDPMITPSQLQATPSSVCTKQRSLETQRDPFNAAGTTSDGQASRIEGELYEWLSGLDHGRGALLQYLPRIMEEFDGSLTMVAAAQLEQPIGEGLINWIDPGFFEAIGCSQTGHRLLFARAILARGEARSSGVIEGV